MEINYYCKVKKPSSEKRTIWYDAGSLAGPVIQATSMQEFMDCLRLRAFLCGMLSISSIHTN